VDMKAKLSIITICYNDRAALERTLVSVHAQTIQDFEHIIVDGGSTDGTVEVIEQNKDRITKWVSEQDGGIYDAQNKGWRMANTVFVQFLNAGDVLAERTVLERVIPQLTTTTEIAYGDADLSNAQGMIGKKVHPARITNAYLMRETVAHQSQFIRKALLEKVGGYDTNYRIAADYAFLARACWELGVVPQYLGLTVSTFDMEGLSSRPDQKEASARERKAIQRRYAPSFWYNLYHGYATFNRLIGR
jgi:glycosyltransferase involved in cell wall biosynthesis